ncbi:MAG: hypothetical protein JJU06_05775 [Ectothiorhodospiraceae bacterium]|nr:hypothetical protein [Ectothiorhodospiraceae bacterium]MCH8502916.1 hypothetical protein [Ectothiorhodospiraceae bacterium]
MASTYRTATARANQAELRRFGARVRLHVHPVAEPRGVFERNPGQHQVQNVQVRISGPVVYLLAEDVPEQLPTGTPVDVEHEGAFAVAGRLPPDGGMVGITLREDRARQPEAFA